MSVNNRKLFANRDARRQLSQMGGIVASSPELLGAAQQFNVGGMTVNTNRSSMIPTTPSAVGGSIAAEALTQDPRIRLAAMRSGMTPAEYVSRLSPEQFSRAIAMLSENMAGTVRDEASFEAAEFDANRYDGPGGAFAVTEPEGLVNAPMLSQSGLTGVQTRPTVSMEDIVQTANAPENRVDVSNDMFSVLASGIRPYLPTGSASATPSSTYDEEGPMRRRDFLQDFQEQGVAGVSREGATVTEGVGLLEQLDALANDQSLLESERQGFAAQRDYLTGLLRGGQNIDDAVADAYALIGRVTGAAIEGAGRGVSVVNPFVGSEIIGFGTDVRESMDPIAEEGFIPGTAEDVPSREEPTVLTAPETAGPDDGTRGPAGEPTDESPPPTLEEVEQVVTTSEDPNAAGARTMLEGAGAGEGFDLGSVEGRISAYEELFTRMLGESDEEKRREKYMNLAMIGFAIAAGEDPNALKNIADGLLAGTAQMQESAAARRERESRIQELAIQAGIGDQQLADRLAAAGAEDAVSWIETPQGEATVELYTELTTTRNMTHDQAIAQLDTLTPGLGATLQRAMSAGVTPPAAADPTALLNQAREAIDAGRDRGTVEQMLRDMGVDPSLLNE